MNATKLPEFSEGPNQQRRQHSDFCKDVLTPKGAPIVARHRAKTMLTPLCVRQAILDDVASKPEPVRLRSLRRRLTALDRALSDLEAQMLERLTSAINALSNVTCIDYLQSEVRSPFQGRLPFGEKRRLEIGAMAYVLKHLSPHDRATVRQLAEILDASAKASGLKPSEAYIVAVKHAAGHVVALYHAWHKSA